MKKMIFLSIFMLVLTHTVLAQQTFYDVTAGDGFGVRFWQSNSYKIHMGTGAEYFYGPVQDYSIKMNMSGGTPNRGWTWGIAGQTPVAALSTLGHFQIAGNIIGNGGLYFAQSGTLADGLPPARFNEAWGIRFNSPDPRWVFSSKPSVLIGYLPTGQNWGNDNLLVAGKIGIGTSAPNNTLSVRGKLGIRADADPTAVAETLRVEGGITAEENVVNVTNLADQDFVVRLSGVGAGAKRTIIGPSVATRFSLGVGVNGGNEHLTIINGGNVGIGTTTPDAKLAVKGQIHAQEVKVDLNGAVAPDYVFASNYQLPTLDYIKTYIDQNKHLPEVPSAKEMETNGVNLGEMNMLLLKKIEELTLYVLSQQKLLSEQNESLKNQSDRITALEKLKQN